MKQIVVALVVLWVSSHGVGVATTISPASGVAASSNDVTIELDPRAESPGYEPESTYRFEIVARNVSHTVGGYDLTISSSNRAVATLLAFEAIEQGDTFTDVSFAPDDQSVRAVVANANGTATDGNVTLGTVTVATHEPGMATLEIDATELIDTTGTPYGVAATTATVTVETEASAGVVPLPGLDEPPKNVDDDPLLEDVDGDGDDGDLFDALTYYNNRDSDVIRNNPDLFDFDGDGTSGDLFDALALYNEIS